MKQIDFKSELLKQKSVDKIIRDAILGLLKDSTKTQEYKENKENFEVIAKSISAPCEIYNLPQQIHFSFILT